MFFILSPPQELRMLLLQHWRLHKQTTGSEDTNKSKKFCPGHFISCGKRVSKVLAQHFPWFSSSRAIWLKLKSVHNLCRLVVIARCDWYQPFDVLYIQWHGCGWFNFNCLPLVLIFKVSPYSPVVCTCRCYDSPLLWSGVFWSYRRESVHCAYMRGCPLVKKYSCQLKREEISVHSLLKCVMNMDFFNFFLLLAL